MNLKLLLTISFLLVFNQFAFSQTEKGSVQGTVKTADGQSAVGIQVLLEGTSQGVITNKEGNFKIYNITTGEYTLLFSFVGLESQRINVSIKSNKIVTIPTLTLKENSQELQEVMITAERLNQFAQKETEYVARIPLKNIENPQSYSVVSGALMREQIVTDIVSSLKSVTGGAPIKSNDGNATMYLRGFRSDAYVRNGMISFARIPVDPANLERVEVIKGPSATLFGSDIQNISTYGGVVNRITKEAKKEEFIEIGYTTGSYDLSRFTLDYNKAVNQDNTLLFRLNTAVHSENSFQDQGFQRNFLIAPSFSYQVNDKLTLGINAEYYQTRRTLDFARGLSRASTATASNFSELNTDYFISYNSNDMAADMRFLTLQATVDYEINENWTSKTSLTTSTLNVEANYSRIEIVDDNTISRRYIQFAPRVAGTTHIQQDFVAKHEFGSFENKLLVGGSFFQFYDDQQRVLFRGPFIEYDQVDLNSGVIPAISKPVWDTLVADLPVTQTINRERIYAIYITDVLSISQKVNLLLAIRYEEYQLDDTRSNGVLGENGYIQNAFSPKLGISITPFDEKLSVFANYMNGFSNNSPEVNANGEIQTFDPEQANQWEVGAKINLFDGKVLSTISYYDIRINNALRTDANGFTIQDGERTSSGFEIDIITNPVKGLNLVAGYTVNNSELVRVTDEALQGNRPAFAPETMWNFWLSYRFIGGNIDGLGIGFGGNYVSQVFNSDANNFSAPEYTVFDATIFYEQPKYRLSIKVDNLSDERYWNAYGMPQNPRNIRASIHYKF